MRASLVTRLGALAISAVLLAGTPVRSAAQQVEGEPASSSSVVRSQGLRPPKVAISPKAHDRAAEITADAQAHYDAGRFEQATEAYRRAYAVVPAPELLFNLGQCQRQLGRPERSLRYFEAYLRLRPDAPHRALVEQLIAEAKLIAPPPESSPGPAVSAAVPAETALAATTAASKPIPDVKVMPLPPPEPLPEPSRRLLADARYENMEETALYERWWFWTALAVVAAGAAVTTYALVEANDDSGRGGSTLGTIEWE